MVVSPLPPVPMEERTEVRNDRVLNQEAPIPPQCYTKTEGVFNPCYTCHQKYDRVAEDRLNPLDDGALQGDYGFSDVGLTNHYTNLFVDKTAWLASIPDQIITEYVEQDNYSPLAESLRAAGWEGFIPDLSDYSLGQSAFDDRGLAKDGSHWVAYNYKPFPGTFWPTNGSTDDVVIRLPASFRERAGVFDRDTYFVNLTLVELTIKSKDRAPFWTIDEKKLGTDLDGDGVLGQANTIKVRDHYVGDASIVPLTFQQFPEGTELMHSVRYLGVDQDDRIFVPPRMKELRYMTKVAVLDRNNIRTRYARERKEKAEGLTPTFLRVGDQGLDNALGWYIKGFIEDYEGQLRPQTKEEDTFCMGCHKAIGSTIDSTFSMARKVLGMDGFGYIDLVGMKDAPSKSGSEGEILDYLKRAGGGSEFRENPEMNERWFDEDGNVDVAAVASADVYTLITPSRERALQLNKAYTYIVRRQSFIFGRDANWNPAENVYETVDPEVPPLQEEYRYFGWDLRLDW